MNLFCTDQIRLKRSISDHSCDVKKAKAVAILDFQKWRGHIELHAKFRLDVM